MTGKNQLSLARDGIITAPMVAAATRESCTADFIRRGVADGTIVLPANINHERAVYVGLGPALTTKINVRLDECGTAVPESADIAVKYGVDTITVVQGDARLEKSPIAFGTIPIIDVLGLVEEPEMLNEELLFETIRNQARQGVDFMILHAGILRAHLPLTVNRQMGIVGTGSVTLVRWMQAHRKENPLFIGFDRILAICREFDVTVLLGDGLSPGCLADTGDDARNAELKVIGKLVKRCRSAKVQCMVECAGPLAYDRIGDTLTRTRKICENAPVLLTRPWVVDCAPGYDHVTGAIGAVMGAFHGAALTDCVFPGASLGCFDAAAIRTAVVTGKMAAHAADIARHLPGAQERDNAISRARFDFDWEKQFELALDPEQARTLRREALAEASDDRIPPKGDKRYCTMCGPNFCSMRIGGTL